MKQPVEIIAEIANAHQGSPKIAEKLAIGALESGADAVKFQVYVAEELLVRSHPRFAHFQRQSFSANAWQHLIAKVQERGARVYCDVFGLKALEIASQAKVYGFFKSNQINSFPIT